MHFYKVRISLITFNNTARVVFPLDRYNNKEDVKLEMDKLRFYGGRTNTAGNFPRKKV